MRNSRETYRFGFRVTCNGESVRLQGSLCAWITEVDDRSIVLEDIDFFDALDWVHSEFLQCGLQSETIESLE